MVGTQPLCPGGPLQAMWVRPKSHKESVSQLCFQHRQGQSWLWCLSALGQMVSPLGLQQENPFLPRSTSRPGRLTQKLWGLPYLPLYKLRSVWKLPEEQNLLSNLIIPFFGEFTVKRQALDLNLLGSAVM